MSKSEEENIFLLPWGGVVCRNCDELGDLLRYKSISEYRDNEKPLWVQLKLVIFRENVKHSFSSIMIFKYFDFQGELFPIYACKDCNLMDPVPGMHMDQTKEAMYGIQCVHSKAAASFFPCWEDHWSITDLDDTDMSYKVFCNQDIRIQTFLDTDRFLAQYSLMAKSL